MGQGWGLGGQSAIPNPKSFLPVHLHVHGFFPPPLAAPLTLRVRFRTKRNPADMVVGNYIHQAGIILNHQNAFGG